MTETDKAETIRKSLQKRYGQDNVWTTAEIEAEFKVQGFGGGIVVVTRKSDGKLGTLDFDHMPRFYYNFKEDN